MRVVLLILLLSLYCAYATVPDKCKIKGFDRPEWSKSSVVSVSEQVHHPVSFAIFPHPVSDYLKIELSGIKGNSANLTIINLLGQVAMSIHGVEIYQGKMIYEIDKNIKLLKPGLYILMMFNEFTYQSTFFIKL